MPSGWKRLCDDIPCDSKDTQWFLWNTADLIKEMAEALEFAASRSAGAEMIETFACREVLKKFKEWK